MIDRSSRGVRRGLPGDAALRGDADDLGLGAAALDRPGTGWTVRRGIASGPDEPGHPGGVLVFGPIVDRYGYRPVLVAGAPGRGAGPGGDRLGALGRLLAPAICVFGFGGGLLNGATNALVSDITPEGRGSGLACWACSSGSGPSACPSCSGSCWMG